MDAQPKWTPGPWKTAFPDSTLVVAPDRSEIAHMTGDYSDSDQWPAMEANACLIAAAPDLYAALAEVTVQLAQCRCHRKLALDEEVALDAARAALAKARGQA